MIDREFVSFSTYSNIKKKFLRLPYSSSELKQFASTRTPISVVHNGKRYFSSVDPDDFFHYCPYRVNRDGKVIKIDFVI